MASFILLIVSIIFISLLSVYSYSNQGTLRHFHYDKDGCSTGYGVCVCGDFTCNSINDCDKNMGFVCIGGECKQRNYNATFFARKKRSIFCNEENLDHDCPPHHYCKHSECYAEPKTPFKCNCFCIRLPDLLYKCSHYMRPCYSSANSSYDCPSNSICIKANVMEQSPKKMCTPNLDAMVRMRHKEIAAEKAKDEKN